jgi:SWI/SNF-related matrix-associated actin-dependent regulator 1 of chromatin subfamily A
LDEAHYLKNPEATRSKAVLGKNGLVRLAKRIWALTGTPAPNHPAEMWTLLYTFNQTKLTYDDFIKRYCNYYHGTYGLQVTGLNYKRLVELKKILSPIIKRRTKKAVKLQLPPITYTTIYVPEGPVSLDESHSFIKYVTPYDRREELKDELVKQTNLLVDVFNTLGPNSEKTLTALGVLNTSVATLRRYTGLQKVKAVADLVIEDMVGAKAYDKLVIFAIHRDVIAYLRIALQKAGLHPLTYYGGTPEAKKQKHIDLFQNYSKHKVFIGNIQACGVAINLTRAHNVIVCEAEWSPSKTAQAIMRCHRIGQTQPCFVRYIALENSIDEKVTSILRRKAREFFVVFDKEGLDCTLQND